MHAVATTLDARSAATAPWSSGRSTLWWALLVSALMHVLIGVPLLAEAMRSASMSAISSLLGSPEERAAALRAEEERQDDPQEPLELLAGIDAGDPVRMTWIGYADYQKHLAQLSTVEQAAFTESVPGNDPDGNGSAGPGEPAPAPGAVPVASAPARVEVAAEQPPPITPDQKPEQKQEQEQEQESPAVESGAKETGPQPIDAHSTAEVEIENPPALPSEGPREASAPAGPAGTSVDEPAPNVEEQPTKESAPPEVPHEAQPELRPNAAPANAAPAGAQSAGGGTPGGVQAERSDRESDARSIIDVPRETWVNGRPLAARGVEIHTRKPVFPLLTRITTSPGNPLCQVEFDRRGKPVRCRVLQSSGYTAEIDEPVLDALYRWRASGRELDRLRESETATFRIRVLLR